MNVETAREYSLSKKAATEDMPFGDDFLTIRVMGKMFLCISFNTPDRITMKCDPDYAIELRDHYNGVEGAWHFNKKYWNQVFLDRPSVITETSNNVAAINVDFIFMLFSVFK